MMAKGIFSTLNSVDVSEKIQKKNGMDYLPWAEAYKIANKMFDHIEHTVKKNDMGLPFFESSVGIFVFTEITINDDTKEMWLPVLNGANQALKTQSYEITTKRGTFTVPAATSADVNKAIMRCLTKNLAMFGLGISLWSKEDLPDIEDPKTLSKNSDEQVSELEQLIKETNSDHQKLLAFFKASSLEYVDYEKCKAMLEKKRSA